MNGSGKANPSYFTPSPRVLAWITSIHRGVYRATQGVLGSTLPQFEDRGRGFLLRSIGVLLLTTRGRKSGKERTVPLPYFVYEGRTFLIGSFAGFAQHPAWYLNLADHPEVEAQIRWRKRRCRAVTVGGAERERLWEMITADWPRYRSYQDATRRTIPLVELVAA